MPLHINNLSLSNANKLSGQSNAFYVISLQYHIVTLTELLLKALAIHSNKCMLTLQTMYLLSKEVYEVVLHSRLLCSDSKFCNSTCSSQWYFDKCNWN